MTQGEDWGKRKSRVTLAHRDARRGGGKKSDLAVLLLIQRTCLLQGGKRAQVKIGIAQATETSPVFVGDLKMLPLMTKLVLTANGLGL